MQVDVTSINCVRSWDWRYDFALQLLLPVILFVVRSIRYAWQHKVWHKLSLKHIDKISVHAFLQCLSLQYLSGLYLTISRYAHVCSSVCSFVRSLHTTSIPKLTLLRLRKCPFSEKNPSACVHAFMRSCVHACMRAC